MRHQHSNLYVEIDRNLSRFERDVMPLPGIATFEKRDCFIYQLIDSTRRISYIRTLLAKGVDQIYTDPSSEHFDPLKAAIWHKQEGNVNEACWLVFIATHFGKHARHKWGLAKAFYSGLTSNVFWDWQTISAVPKDEFITWLNQNSSVIKSHGSFSNHRKYLSLNPQSKNGTGAAITSYLEWIGPNHETFFETVASTTGTDPNELFDRLYHLMSAVVSFGRIGKFDYLTMIGKMELLDIQPGSPYMSGATGPKDGALLLFLENPNDQSQNKELNELIIELGTYLDLYFGMQVLEDAICNWQKSPASYIYFNG
jgi:hypothetical protein